MSSSKSLFFLRWLPGALLLALGPLACANRWGQQHEEALTMAERPECPTNWGDSIPWFPYERDPRSPSPIAIALVAPIMVPIPGGVPGSEATTDIPEFNDCQRFVTVDEQQFDSLFAIFAGSKQDSITRDLRWDVVQWTSSNMSVAEVSSAGVVTAKDTGSAIIRARSEVDPQVSASKTIFVSPVAVSPKAFAIDLGASGVDTLSLQEQRPAISPLGAPTPLTLPVATIYSYGQFYDRLGIEPNFNCVYLYFDGARRISARVVPVSQLQVPDKVNACKRPIDPKQNNVGTRLTVVRRAALNEKRDAYPAVARWDWHPAEKKQFFGLGCADAWCEVGVVDPPTPYVMPVGTPPGDQRVVSIKGWHDEQVLAVPDAADPDKLVPSFLRATVIPHPDLKDQGWTETMKPDWRIAAYIAIRDLSGESVEAIAHYRNAMNIDLAPIGPLKEMNEMAYCFGRFWQCGGLSLFLKAVKCDPGATYGKRWWVRITPAPGSDVLNRAKVYCVTRRTHGTSMAAFTIPSTSRWRWIILDDTVWTECVQGCCQTERDD